jgi:hypothetical protein
MITRSRARTRAAAAKKIQDVVRRKQSAPRAIKATPRIKPKPMTFTLTAPMKNLVDKRIDRHQETIMLKNSLFPDTNNTQCWYGIKPYIDYLNVATIIPRISQSSEAEANVNIRKGNSICPKYCYVKLRLWVDQNDTTYGLGAGDRCAITPYIFVGNHRSRKAYDVLTQNNWECLADFWRCNGPFGTTNSPAAEGMGDSKGFNGKRYQFNQGKLNTEKFMPVKGGVKSFNMTRPLGYAVLNDPLAGGAGFAIPYNGREFYIKVPMPAKLKYTDNTSEYPSNHCPFVAIGFTYMSGAAPNDETPLRVESTCTFAYTDA